MPGETGINLDFSEFNRNLATLSRQSKRGGRQLVRDVGFAIVAQSSARAPIKEGHLKGSGKLVEIGKPLSVEIGHTVNYAAAVHERTELRHEQGEAKYMENAVVQDGPEILENAARDLGRRLGTS